MAVANDTQAILANLHGHPADALLVMLAFDGVLAGYRDDPGRVMLSHGRRALLRRITRAPRVAVGMISGRPVEELRRRTGVDGVFLAGLHGLEIAGPGIAGVERPFGVPLAARLRAAADRVRFAVAGLAGVRVECDEAVLALHTRRAGSHDTVWSRFQLLSAANDLIAQHLVRVVRG